MSSAHLLGYTGFALAFVLAVGLAACLVTGRTRPWTVFSVGSLVATVAYGIIGPHYVGDSPGGMMGLLLCFVAIGVLSVIFLVLWNVASQALRSVMKIRDTPPGSDPPAGSPSP
jgi:hypothetical protein